MYSSRMPAREVVSELENNTFRALNALANDPNPITDFFHKGVHGDMREDPLQSVATRPASWRVIHRTLQQAMRAYNLPQDYPDRWYLLQEEDSTWVNDYHDLQQYVGKRTSPASSDRNIPMTSLQFMEATQKKTDLELWAAGLMEPEPPVLDKKVKAADRVLSVEQRDQQVDAVTVTDRDLQWEQLNFFTPRLIITEGATLTYLWDHLLGKTSWEMLPRMMPPPYGHNHGIALVIYAQILQSVYAPLDGLVTSTGLPSVMGLVGGKTREISREISWPHKGTLLNKAVRSSASSKSRPQRRRRLFLVIDENWDIFQAVKRAFTMILPSNFPVYDLGMAVIEDSISGMSAVACLFFLVAAIGFTCLLHIFAHHSYKISVNRDVANHHHGMTAFYVALNVALLPLQVVSAILVSLPFILMSGFQSDIHLTILGLSILITIAMFSVSKFICSLTASLEQAVRVLPLLLVFFVLLSGFVIRTGDLSSYIHPWLSSISPYRWGLFGLSLVAMTPGKMTHQTPNDWMLGISGIESRSVGWCCAALIFLSLGFRLLGGLAFAFLHTKRGVL